MTKSIHHHVHKLALLDALVAAGTFKEACARTRLTQSALSQAVSLLEGLFDQVLIVRDKGRVTPTDAGIRLLNEMRPILANLEGVARRLDKPAAIPPMTWLDFGAYESFAVNVLPALMQRLSGKLPGLKLTLRTGRSAQLSTMVRKGELCMALVTQNDRMSGLATIRLGSDRLGLYAAASRGGAQASRGYATIGFGADGPPRYYQRFVKQLGLEAKPTLICDGFETVRSVVASGALIGILPHRVARRGPDLEEITPRGVDADSGEHGLFLISRKGCDPEENAFLAEELTGILQES